MKKEDGFTYLEIIVSFVLFGLILVMVLRIGDSVNSLIRAGEETNQMIHIAELELENYKSGIENISGFSNTTGFILMIEDLDSESNVIRRVWQNDNIDEAYHVEIVEEASNEFIKNIRVVVESNILDLDPVSIEAKILLDSR